MINMSEQKYSDYVMECVRQNLGLKPNNTSKDEQINEMDKDEILERVATWNNIIGYGPTIREWIEDIWCMDLDEASEIYNG
jgi:hypothetical protein